MIQQASLQVVEAIFRWFYGIAVADGLWELLARTYSGIAFLVDWTLPFPYVPYRAMEFAITNYIALYMTLLIAGFFLRAWGLLREAKQTVS